MSVGFSGPSGAVIDDSLLEQRIAQILKHLGLNREDIEIRGSYTDPNALRLRRKLQQQFVPSLLTPPLDTSGCNENATTLVFTVSLKTNNETIEKQFIQLLQEPFDTPLVSADGQNFTRCTDPEVTSQRLVVAAPSPPNMPPLPFIGQTTIARTGTISVGLAAGLLFGVACFGQWCLAPTIRRRKKAKTKAAADSNTGESLTESLMSWGGLVQGDNI